MVSPADFSHPARSPTCMKRRKFLSLAAAGTAALPWAMHAASAGQPDALTVVATPRLLEILRDEGAVAAIGERYRKIVTAEDNVPVLVQAVLSDVNANATAPAPAVLKALIEDRVRRDFSEGRTVVLNGWV